MKKQLFIGVDGGASKCLLRLEDEAGKCLAECENGPANIRLSVNLSWQAIEACLAEALQTAKIAPKSLKDYAIHAGMGLAGVEITAAKEAFLRHQHPFTTLHLTSDAHIACLGAHAGKDGAVIIAGTGVVGFKSVNGQFTKVSGWGFPHDDLGGGAWIGLEAVKLTLQALDGREPASTLTHAILTHFNEDQNHLVAWANQATSTHFATLAPLVLEHAKKHDASATHILKQAAVELERVWLALQRTEGLVPCSITGGIAPHIMPYLTNTVKNALQTPKSTPAGGAIILARQQARAAVGVPA